MNIRDLPLDKQADWLRATQNLTNQFSEYYGVDASSPETLPQELISELNTHLAKINELFGVEGPSYSTLPEQVSLEDLMSLGNSAASGVDPQLSPVFWRLPDHIRFVITNIFRDPKLWLPGPDSAIQALPTLYEIWAEDDFPQEDRDPSDFVLRNDPTVSTALENADDSDVSPDPTDVDDTDDTDDTDDIDDTDSLS